MATQKLSPEYRRISAWIVVSIGQNSKVPGFSSLGSPDYSGFGGTESGFGSTNMSGFGGSGLSSLTLPISQFSVGYMYNRIPRGKVAFAVGTNAKSPMAINQLQMYMSQFRKKFSTKLYMSVNGSTFLVFDGYIAGIGYDRNYQSFGLSANLVSFMEDLEESEAHSAAFAANSASDFRAPQAWATSSGTGAALGINPLPTPESGNFLDPVTLQTDITEGVLNALRDVCKSGRLIALSSFLAGQDPRAADPNGKIADNTTALRALLPSRIIHNDLPVSGGELDTTVLRKYLQGLIYSHPELPTIWNKMVTAFVSLNAAIIPYPECYRIAAHSPVVSTNLINKTIFASEYDNISSFFANKRIIRGVVFGVIEVQGTGNTETNVLRKYAYSSSWEDVDSGMYLACPPVPWLLLVGDGNNIKKTVLDAIQGHGKYTFNPTPSSTPLSELWTNEKNNKLAFNDINNPSLAARTAKGIWLDEVFRDRHAQLHGKLRLDICPGTPVKIEVARNQMNTASFMGDVMYADVESVTINVNCASSPPDASTVFGLGHIRTESENVVGARIHPLFDTLFTGDHLVPNTTGVL